MKIIKCSNDVNFGDGIVKNGFLEILCKNKQFKYIFLRTECKEINYITIGSVLRSCDENSIICGAGFIDPKADLGCLDWKFNNKVHRIPKEILFVRGKLTRDKLIDMGVKCPEYYGDLGILCPLVYKPKLIIKKFKIGILPHYVDVKKLDCLLIFLDENNIEYTLLNIKSARKPQKLIDEILKCEYLISSTLHGIILGIVYNIKTIWIKFSNQIVGGKFKFDDFFSSLNYKYSPCDISMDMFNNYIKINNKELLNIGISQLKRLPLFINNEIRDKRIEEWTNIINNYISY